MRNLDTLVSQAVRTAHAAGQQQALTGVYAALGRTLAAQLNLTPAAPAVAKAHDRAQPPSDPDLEADPHAALLLAQIDHQIRCRESNADAGPGDRALHALWHSPEALAAVLAPHMGDEPQFAKAVAYALFLKAAEHAPKGGISMAGKFFPGGQWIPAADVAAATPEEKTELAERKAGARPNPLSKREKASAAAADKRGTRDEVRKRVAQIATHIMLRPDLRTPDMYRDLADAIRGPHLSVPDLRALRLKLSASFGGGRRKEQMVAALLQHAEAETSDLNNPQPEPPALPGVPKQPKAPKPGTFAVLKTGSIAVDPARFQFKLKIDAEGVTDQFKNTEKFEPDFAGVISVWYDPADGKTYCINGHHRIELAKRFNYPSLACRYIEAKDAREARARGALINIAGDRGTPIDAAKFIRDSGGTGEELFKYGISHKSPLARDAAILTKLNDHAFDRLARGGLSMDTALAVAKHVEDPARQEKLFKLIAKKEDSGEKFTQRHLEEMARQMAAAPASSKTTGGLFGDITEEDDAFLERADLASHVRSELAKEHGDFKALSSERRAGATAEAGNILNTEENRNRADAAEVHKHAYDTLAHRKGPVSDALDAGAVAIKQAKTKKEKERVRSQTLARVRSAVADAAAGRVQPADAPGVAAVDGGRAEGSGTEPGASGATGAGEIAADGRGAGDGESGVKPLPSVADVIVHPEHAGSSEPPSDKVSLGDSVVVPAGTSVGMGKLKAAASAKVIGLDSNEHGEPFYHISWVDPKTGRERTTYLTANKFHRSSSPAGGRGVASKEPPSAAALPSVADIVAHPEQAAAPEATSSPNATPSATSAVPNAAPAGGTGPAEPASPLHALAHFAGNPAALAAESQKLADSANKTSAQGGSLDFHDAMTAALRGEHGPEVRDAVSRALDDWDSHKGSTARRYARVAEEVAKLGAQEKPQAEEAKDAPAAAEAEPAVAAPEAKPEALGSDELNPGDTVTRDSAQNWNRGAVVADSKGKQYRVHGVRGDVLTAHPIVNGKAVVNSESGVKFVLDANEHSRAKYPVLDEEPNKWRSDPLTYSHNMDEKPEASGPKKLSDRSFEGRADDAAPSEEEFAAASKPAASASPLPSVADVTADPAAHPAKGEEAAAPAKKPKEKKAKPEAVAKSTSSPNAPAGRASAPAAPAAPSNPHYKPASREEERHIYAAKSAREITGTPDMTRDEKAAAAALAPVSKPTDQAERHATGSHLSDLEAIPKGDSRFVAGHRVRHTASGQFQVEHKGTFHTGDADSVSKIIRGNWRDSWEYPSRKSALDRAAKYTEPSPFEDVAGADRDAKAREAVPEGEKAVSLDPDTYGRVGTVRHDEGNGRAFLQFGSDTETRGHEFEPLREEHSWRHGKRKDAKPAAKPAGLFGEEGGEKKPASQSGMVKHERERSRREVDAAKSRARQEQSELFSNEKDNLFTDDDSEAVTKALETLPAPQAIALAARLTGVPNLRTRFDAVAAYEKAVTASGKLKRGKSDTPSMFGGDEDEEKHPRETTAHDGKRPGEFAPKGEGKTAETKEEEKPAEEETSSPNVSPEMAAETDGEPESPPASAQSALFSNPESSPVGDSSAAPAPRGPVHDFGEVIPGARKHAAVPVGPRQRAADEAEKTKQPAWRRQYTARQDAKSGKWFLTRGGGSGMRSNMVYVGGKLAEFPTKEQAEELIPLHAAAQSHSVTNNARQGEPPNYVIVRKIGDRKRPVVKDGFASYDDAMTYLATRPEEILNHKFPDWEDYSYLDHVERTGPDTRKGDVTPEDFHKAFGFRGGQFGNWQTNKSGQTSLNHAYDSLHDLADVTGLTPKQLALDGKLAIAFGARGHGGKHSAKAHYEPAGKVINLTKLEGAGALGHEWFHSLDHHVANLEHGENNQELLTAMRTYKPKHPELVDAWKGLVDAMTTKATTTPRDVEKEQKRHDSAKENVGRGLEELEYNLRSQKQFNKRFKELSDEDRKKWDEAKAAILAGEPGEDVSTGNHFTMLPVPKRVHELNEIYKKATGRSLIRTEPESAGRKLAAAIVRHKDAKDHLEAAKHGASETRKGRTNFLADAHDIDRQHHQDYASLPEELAARAFSAYLQDRLAEKGRKSDYLTAKAENKHYAPYGLKPYPEGDEREAINAAFDKLFEAVKKHHKK